MASTPPVTLAGPAPPSTPSTRTSSSTRPVPGPPRLRPHPLTVHFLCIFLQAVIKPPAVPHGKPLLRITAMVTDPANSIFFYGGDHMGVSPAAELLAEGLKCRAGGRETPARARYVGAQVDSKLANTVRTGDVLMLIECEVDGIAEIDGVHPKGTTVVLEVTSSGSAKAAQQIPLRMCLSERLRQELAICSSPVYNWEPRFVVEWIEYHRTLGVQHVYLYDRELRYEGPLQSLIKEGAVTVIPWKSHCPKNDCTAGVGEYFDQFGALDACKQRFGHATEWLAHIDMDERLYMAPAQRKLYGADFKNFLHRIRCNAPSVAEVSLNSIIYYGEQVDKGLQSHRNRSRNINK